MSCLLYSVSIVECPLSEISLHVVINLNISTVVPRCTTGDYRVRNETFTYDETDIASYSGRIEVCVDGLYIALCDSGFTARAAELACRSQNREPPFFRKFVMELD